MAHDGYEVGAPLSWSTRQHFEVGVRYIDTMGGATVEFAGVMPAAGARSLVEVPEVVSVDDDFEPVVLFALVDDPGRFLTHTYREERQGVMFRPLVDESSGPQD